MRRALVADARTPEPEMAADAASETSSSAASATESDAQVVERIYADGVAMVQLLGPQDRLLRVVEREHPAVDVHVRGNEIALTGSAPLSTARCAS